MSASNDPTTAPLIAVRTVAFVLLFLHCYVHFYAWWELLQLTYPLLDRVLLRFEHTVYFCSYGLSYGLPLGVLAVGVLVDKAKKSEYITYRQAVATTAAGAGVYAAALLAHYIGELLVSGAVYVGTHRPGLGAGQYGV